MVRVIPDQEPGDDGDDPVPIPDNDNHDVTPGPPKPIYEAKDLDGVWGLAVTKYPPDEVVHFFILIAYMAAFYAFLNLVIHILNSLWNKRYQKLDKVKQGEYR